jgi:hypothetical protein
VSGKSARFDKLVPWAGLVLGALGAGFAHQVGSDSTFHDCAFASPVIVWIGGLAGLFVVFAGAGLSWSVWRRRTEGAARRLIAGVSLMTAALLALTIILALTATLIIPPCHA